MPPPSCSGCGVDLAELAAAYAAEGLRWPPLTPVQGWGDDTALLCPKCRLGWRRNRGRARYSKPRASDGRLTA